MLFAGIEKDPIKDRKGRSLARKCNYWPFSKSGAPRSITETPVEASQVTTVSPAREAQAGETAECDTENLEEKAMLKSQSVSEPCSKPLDGFAVRVMSHCERTVTASLSAKGFDVCLPLCRPSRQPRQKI